MKKNLLIGLLSLFTIGLFAQAKKPTLLVVPSESWCANNGYTQVYYNQGEPVLVPNYEIAVQTSSELNAVIAKVNELLAEREFPAKDLAQSLRSIKKTNAENSVIASKTSGAEVAESPIDQLRKTAKADIIIEVDWILNSNGPKKSITYTLKGLDSYTDKQVAGASGTGAPSFSAEVPLLLQEAVESNMDQFTSQLQNHFDDMFANGREVTIDIQVFDNGSGLDLESEYGGKELSEVIEDWMADNSVNGRFNLSDATETFMLFEQVRIPLQNDKGRAMDTNGFARDLVKYLKAAPYNIDSKLVNRGLGRALIILGEK